MQRKKTFYIIVGSFGSGKEMLKDMLHSTYHEKEMPLVFDRCTEEVGAEIKRYKNHSTMFLLETDIEMITKEIIDIADYVYDLNKLPLGTAVRLEIWKQKYGKEYKEWKK